MSKLGSPGSDEGEPADGAAVCGGAQLNIPALSSVTLDVMSSAGSARRNEIW